MKVWMGKLFEAYNVRTACVQLNISIPQDDTSPPHVSFVMAPTKDKNVSMDVVKRGGTNLFDYSKKIELKLDKAELAGIGKYIHPFYCNKLGTPVVDTAGNPVKDKNGQPVVYKHVITHMFEGVTRTIIIGPNNQDSFGCSLAVFQRKGAETTNYVIYLTADQFFDFAYSCLEAVNMLISRNGQIIEFKGKSNQQPEDIQNINNVNNVTSQVDDSISNLFGGN